MSVARLDSITVAPPRESPSDTKRLQRRLIGDTTWLVEAGHVDVFASMPHEVFGVGRRYHLFRLERGRFLFGLPESDGLIVEVIGADGASIQPVARRLIEAKLVDELRPTRLLRAIDAWVDALSEFVAGAVPPAECAPCGVGQDIEGTARCIRPLSEAAGVELLSGDGRLFGAPDLVVSRGRAVMLSARGWIELEEAAGARLLAVTDLAERGMFWPALDEFHRLALEGIRRRFGAIAESERRRQRAKGASARSAHNAALTDLAAAFHGGKSDVLPAATAGPVTSARLSQLNAACSIVASRLRIPFVASTASYRTAKEGVDNVARASQIRARQVLLADDWWCRDQGPLVGFLKAESRPVALLPRGHSSYDVVDPTAPGPQRVSAAVAATLLPAAFTFYRPFEPGPLGFVKLLRFGTVGCERELLTVLLTGSLAGVVATAVPIATGVLINTIIPSTDRLQLAQWIVLLIVGAVVTTLFQAARAIALIRLEMKLAYSVQAAVWDRLLSLPSQFFRRYAAGNLAVRAAGIDTVRQTLSGGTIRAILGSVFSIFNFVLLFYYDVQLALCAAALIAVVVAVFASVTYFQRSQQREVARINAKTSGLVLQFLSGIRKLRVAAAEPRALQIWARLFTSQRRARLRINRLGNLFKVFISALPLLAYAALFSVVLSMPAGRIRTGDFLAFLAAFSACLGATLATAGAAIGTLSVVPQYEMARPIFETAPEVTAGQTEPGPLSGDIVLDHVIFHYNPEAPPVLNDVSVHVKAGEFVAFVGPSGSGKSTILRMLLGFDVPQSGAIYYDGKDFKDLDRRAVRHQIGVVLQNGRLMPGDIYTNIAGASSASLEQAWTASRAAGFDEDILRMPMGMHTMVTEGGGSLSGGQRQRLMIARAIVNAPAMLFFDEATSALDNRTQALVGESLKRMRATRLVVAHRLSTIAAADKIVVVEKGRVVQVGTYDELCAAPGLFRELANRELA